MLGHVNGLVALAKEQNPKVEVSHWMIYRQALAVKQFEPGLESIAHGVVKIVNVVKGHALNVWLFRMSCEDEKSEYFCPLFHTEVR